MKNKQLQTYLDDARHQLLLLGAAAIDPRYGDVDTLVQLSAEALGKVITAVELMELKYDILVAFHEDHFNRTQLRIDRLAKL